MRSISSPISTSLWTGPITSLLDSWSMMPVFLRASRMFTDRFSGLKGRPVCSRPGMAPAIAAFIRSRLPGLVPSCAEGGVLGILPGLVGLIQATEAIKLILGNGEPLVGRLLLIDALGMKFRELKLRKNPDCVVCGKNPTVTKLIDYDEFCGLRPQDLGFPVAAAGGLEASESETGPIDVVDAPAPVPASVLLLRCSR